MKHIQYLSLLSLSAFLRLVGLALCGIATAENARLKITGAGNSPSLRVVGSSDFEWWMESSTNLITWSRNESSTPLAAGTETTAPRRAIDPTKGPGTFYRSIATDGLYDSSFLRTIRFYFSQPDWAKQLAAAHGTESNVLCRIEMDNGIVLGGVGARYKGFSSYSADIPKKSLNIQVDHTDPDAEVLGYENLNLNNASGDKTLLREVVFFNVMHRFAPSPRAALAQVYINDAFSGVYTLAQQEDADLIREWFPSAEGDRWRTPNKSSGSSSLNWLGPDLASYQPHYDLRKSSDSQKAWGRLVHAIDILNNTPESSRRDAVEDVFAVDSWLWFLAVGNIFAEEDSYMLKGADYSFYFEPESGRIHPLEHDGNEGLHEGLHEVSPLEGLDSEQRPMISKLLSIPELRQRYLAHMRTVLSEAFRPEILTPRIDQWSEISIGALTLDTNKGFHISEYPEALQILKTFVTNRYQFLTRHAELTPRAPAIFATAFLETPIPEKTAVVLADVRPARGDGIRSVWLWTRVGPTGKYRRTQMWDDGAHLDRGARDGIFAAETPTIMAGTTLHYYVEARSDNAAGTASFLPSHAEVGPKLYRVPIGGSLVRINEFMADNESGARDPQGQRDDWIELKNLSGAELDVSGYHLSDDPGNPRKWKIPAGTKIPAHGYLLIWADEDASDTPGLHAAFKLSASGETIVLADTDERSNAVLDTVSFGRLSPDQALGRTAAEPAKFQIVPPTPGTENP